MAENELYLALYEFISAIRTSSSAMAETARARSTISGGGQFEAKF